MKRVVLIGLLALVLVSLVTVSVGAGVSQTWYFTGRAYAGSPANDGTRHSCDNFMTKSLPHGPLKLEWIGEICKRTRTAWWYAERPAGADVAFGEGTWHVNLWYWNSFRSGTLYADVYSVRPDGQIDRLLASGSVPITAVCKLQSVSIACSDAPGPQTVLEGYRLAVRLKYETDYPFDGMLVFYNCPKWPSSLVSPATDPGYPLPELPTVALLGSGLVLMVGYWGLRRSRAVARNVEDKVGKCS